MAFNYLHSKLVPIFKEYYTHSNFYILVTNGSFKTSKSKGGYNEYSIKYEMYLDDVYIKFSRFYRPFDLAKALKLEIDFLELFYVKKE